MPKYSRNVLCQPMQESRALLIILFHIHSIFFQKNKKFKCLYQNRSADLADGLFLEFCFHVRGNGKFFDYVKNCTIGNLRRFLKTGIECFYHEIVFLNGF